MEPLPNPERDWERTRPAPSLDVDDVERRIGPVNEPLVLLSGGLANLNIRVGDDRVLRIHLRDASTVRKEGALLRRRWQSFRVPAVLDEGEDFLLLEYVPHRPVTSKTEHARAAGQALAEIHTTRFERTGFLDGNLEVTRPFADLVAELRAHVESELRGGELPAPMGVRVVETLARHASSLSGAAGPPVLLHGDFKPSNLHWAGDRLLLLDWEFAWSGGALLDVGQLLRWSPPREFVETFAAAYRADGGTLAGDWERLAACFDLVNLVGLASGSAANSKRRGDLIHRIDRTLAGLR